MDKIHCDVCDEIMESRSMTTEFLIDGKQILAHIEFLDGNREPIDYDICKNCLTDQLKQDDRRPRLA